MLQKMFPRMLEFWTVKAQAYQPDTKSKRLVVASGSAHDRTALRNRLCGDGQTEIDIGRRLPRVQRRVETAPFYRTAIEHRMQIRGIVARPVVVTLFVHISLIPDFLQRRQVFCFRAGEFPRLAQHGFAHLSTPVFRSFFIDLKRLKEQVLFGIHNTDQILQALAVMVGAVHMDVQAAGAVDFCACVAHLSNALLQFWKLRIGQLGRDHLHTVRYVVGRFVAPVYPAFCINTGVTHQFPYLTFRIFYGPGIVSASRINRLGFKIVCQRPRSLFTGDTSHFHLYPEALILDSDFTHVDSSSPL